ncbi:hypothetical protein Tco_1008640, partial [Tanacetum coccineum]
QRIWVMGEGADLDTSPLVDIGRKGWFITETKYIRPTLDGIRLDYIKEKGSLEGETEGANKVKTTSGFNKEGKWLILMSVRRVTLVDEAQGRIDDNLMFDTGVFDKQEVEVEKLNPNGWLTTATTTVVTRPKARRVVVQEPSEFKTTTSSSQTSQLPQVKDKGKAKIIEPEKPLKKKDQILVDEEIAQRLQEELQAKLEEEERLERQKEEDELAQRLQAEEQAELTIEERSKLFVELMNKRKKHFAKLRAEEIKRKPPTKAQKRNQMCTYLKNMANYKHSQLKNKSFKEIQMLFDNTMKWVDSFIPMDSEVVKGSKR